MEHEGDNYTNFTVMKVLLKGLDVLEIGGGFPTTQTTAL